jgi:hypothetical protein
MASSFTQKVAATAAAATTSAATTLRFTTARRQLAQLGVQALQPEKKIIAIPDAPMVEPLVRWRKPVISRRVANGIRKEALAQGTYGTFDPNTLTGWDAAWDAALSAPTIATDPMRGIQGRYRIKVPRQHKRDRTREKRAAKIDANMIGMDDRMVQLWKEKSDGRKRNTDFESVYKEMMKIKK